MTRLTVRPALFAAACLLVTLRAEPAAADDKKTIAILQNQVAQLKAELQAAQQQVNALKAANAQLQAALKKPPAVDPAVKSLQAVLDGYRNAGLVHVVVLKLKADSSAGEAQALIDDATAQLTTIRTVRGLWAGQPSAKGTPDAVTDYTVTLVVLFDDAAGLKTYLNDPVHSRFAAKHLKLWETPTVYDFDPKKPLPVPADPNANVKALQTAVDGYRGAGLIHVVVMKLKTDSSGGEPQALIDDATAQLTKVRAVRGLWAGTPSKAAPGPKGDYTVAVVVAFDDAAGLKSFLNDPVHTRYVSNHIKKWEPAVVYDLEPKSAAP